VPKHSRVTLFSILNFTYHHHESSERTQTDAPNANGKNTRSAQIPHSQIPPKQQKLWRNMRGRKKEKHQELQDLTTNLPSLRGETQIGLVEE
jgi:hypothetical protein